DEARPALIARERLVRPVDVHRDDGDTEALGEDGRAVAERFHLAVARDAALGEDADEAAALEDLGDAARRAHHAPAAAHRDRAEPAQDPSYLGLRIELARHEPADRPSTPRADEERVEERGVVRQNDRGTTIREVRAPDDPQAEAQRQDRREEDAKRDG